jgi:two-component system chemotaxis sensor kinase CheA
MPADRYKYFRVEAAELHAELGQGVLDLERGTRGPDLVPRLLRLAHTLKGAARVVKQREIADHAHAFEEALAPARESTEAVPRARIDVLLALLDDVGRRIAALTAPPEAEVAAPAARPVPEESFRTVRANVAEMDALLEGIGEAHIQLGAVRRSKVSLERARHLIDLLVEQLASPRGREGVRPNAAGASKTHSLAQELQSALTGVDQGLSSGVDQLDQELRQVRDAAEQMRLVPAGALFTSLERAVRDVAQAQGKQVLFEGRGGDVRLDAHVLGAVQGALVQLVRNAVAHGIEIPGDRTGSGKPIEGSVTLDVSRRGRHAAFTCSDDGRGVDLEAVRRAAERKGLLSAESRELAAEPLVDLLLRGGLSTSSTVTELSGRGIGLDLLRAAAEQLGGHVSIRTGAGTGTTVELVVPVSLASLLALMVEAGGVTAAVPLDAVRQTLRIAHSDVARTAHGESIVHSGKMIPFVSLARALGARSMAAGAARTSAVIIEGAKGLCAVGVDRLLGTVTVIQRPLPDLAPATAVVAGASIDSSGNPQLVLDPDGLLAGALGAGLAPERAEVSHRPILVIDDSLTTRMLEQSILESAGYEVDVAASAEEALEKAPRKPYALFLVDVEMPGMDGFSFIQHTREDPSLRDVPCILVTSRASPDDRRRGQEVGARGHIVKGEFDQNALLDQIRKLVG